jgi:hypothetical protein
LNNYSTITIGFKGYGTPAGTSTGIGRSTTAGTSMQMGKCRRTVCFAEVCIVAIVLTGCTVSTTAAYKIIDNSATP